MREYKSAEDLEQQLKDLDDTQLAQAAAYFMQRAELGNPDALAGKRLAEEEITKRFIEAYTAGSIKDWIYNRSVLRYAPPELERKIEAAEDALGFKLFVWQLTYLVTGSFRAYGRTTAEILKDLLNTDTPPLDLRRPASKQAAVYRHQLIDTAEKLEAADVQIRELKV